MALPFYPSFRLSEVASVHIASYNRDCTVNALSIICVAVKITSRYCINSAGEQNVQLLPFTVGK
jgi:hypothetical protein